MPIMDGYEACILIYEHLLANIPKDEFVFRAPIIYALTADCSEQTKKAIIKLPFANLFSNIGNQKEVVEILAKVKQKQSFL